MRGFIDFHFKEIDRFPLSEEFFREWICVILNHEKGHAGVLNFIFCTDDYLMQLNKDYLEHDTLTDVITFNYNDQYEGISGDIFISIERVKYNAHKYSVSFLDELSRVIVHGVLHLLGYDDHDADDKLYMTRKEDEYLQLLKSN